MEAQRPAIVDRPAGGRVIVFSAGTATSGIPPAWIATDERRAWTPVPSPGFAFGSRVDGGEDGSLYLRRSPSAE
jgi:hypothetical protein